MPHPVASDAGDPLLARLRRIALALPEAEERMAHGRPWFCTRTGFAVFGGGTAPPEHLPRPRALLVRIDDDELPARRQDPRFFTPAYLGPRGWLGLDLEGADWDEVAELVDASYRRTAPARLVRALDAR